MSITRNFFNEFRPFFRLLEEPMRHPAYYSRGPRTVFDDPFFNTVSSLRPAVDVHEDGSKYTVEAELPGVKKENIEVHIGEGGRSLTIEGRIPSRRAGVSDSNGSAVEASQPSEGAKPQQNIVQSSEASQISSERSYVENASFSRTVWLPRPVDARNVSAKLADGILTVSVNKADDISVKVAVE